MKNRWSPSFILLAVLWLLSAGAAIAQTFLPLKALDFVIGLSSFAFIIVLIWTLARKKPSVSDLPESRIFPSSRLSFWMRTILILLGMGITFFLGLMIGTGFSLMLVCGFLGLCTAIAWRKQLTGRIIWTGLSAGIICGLGTAFLGNQDYSWAVANLVLIPPAFMGGALIFQRTRLGHLRLVEGEPGLGLRSFLIACVLAVPAALLNLLGNLQLQDTWVSSWWQPLYAIVPGIAEETWARLFLVSFCYALLRPSTNQNPRRAVVVALLASVIAHGFAHTGIDPFGIIIGSLLYSLPVGLLMIKKDFEYAVGYHFLIDFARFMAAYLSRGA